MYFWLVKVPPTFILYFACSVVSFFSLSFFFILVNEQATQVKRELLPVKNDGKMYKIVKKIWSYTDIANALM